MAKVSDHTSETDPRTVLGLSEKAGADDIRRAYLEKIKIYPPDRSPEMFEKIRDAYELLRDPRKRTAFYLKNIDPEAPFVSILQGGTRKRRKIGPELWLGVMKDGMRGL